MSQLHLKLDLVIQPAKVCTAGGFLRLHFHDFGLPCSVEPLVFNRPMGLRITRPLP